MIPNQTLVAYSNAFKKLTFSFFLLVAFNAFAQVGVGTQTPMTTLDVSVGATPAALATGNGVTVPSVTDAATTAVAGTNDGQLVYDTTAKAFYYWNAGTSAWTVVGGGGGSAWTYVAQATAINVGESMFLPGPGTITVPATANDGDQIRLVVINAGGGFTLAPSTSLGLNTFNGDLTMANGAVTYEWFNDAWWCISF